MKYLKLLPILLIVCFAHAEVNKCVDTNGNVIFTDKACKHGQTLTPHPPIQANTNKCIDSKGKVTFTDKACQQDQIGSVYEIQPMTIIDSTADRQAIQQLKTLQQQQAKDNYYKSLKYAADRQRAEDYDSHIKLKNAQRMFSPNRRCFYESGLVRCY